MKLIVGLGNPGDQYRWSRHNVGFLVLELLINTGKKRINTDTDIRIRENQFINQCKSVSAWKLNKRLESEIALATLAGGGKVIMAKPQTMMNASGRAVKKLMSFYKVKAEDLLVVHDDLDLRLGEFKLQLARGPKVHNGVNSVEVALGTKAFWRLRVGVDNRPPAKRIPGEEYVLQGFTVTEKRALEALIEDKLLSQITVWMTGFSSAGHRRVL